MPERTAANRFLVLAEHYHRAADAANQRWGERNRQFLSLIGVLALAVLLTYNPNDTNSLLLGVFGRLAGVDASELQKLKESFPYVVLHGLLIVLVFYFMTDVFRLNASIIRNYEYLRGLERGLRHELDLHEDEEGFSRETSFYDTYRVPWNWLVKIAYVLIVGGMLVLFLAFRVTSDWPAGGLALDQINSLQSVEAWFRRHFLLLIDLVVGGMTALMYLGYARLSFWPPKRKVKARPATPPPHEQRDTGG